MPDLKTTAVGLALASMAALAFSYSKTVLAATGSAQAQSDISALAQQTVIRFNLNADPKMLVAMAWIESGFKPDAMRYEPAILDASVGLMQTLRRTARDMWAKGYKAYPEPDYADLRKSDVSMYFGAAYVEWLKKWYTQNRGGQPSEEWIVRAYNGGPGWQNSSATARAMTANHWAKYQEARRRFG